MTTRHWCSVAEVVEGEAALWLAGQQQVADVVSSVHRRVVPVCASGRHIGAGEVPCKVRSVKLAVGPMKQQLLGLSAIFF